MQENQNAYQNAGQNGYFNYQAFGNQTSTIFVLILAFMLFVALMKSEDRYRKLMERMPLPVNETPSQKR